MKIYSYNQGSESAKALAAALDVKRIKHEGKKLNVKDTLINWGASSIVDRVIPKGIVVNKPESIALAANKLLAFRAMEGKVSIPEFTDDKDVAEDWLEYEKDVVVRSKLNGHSGEGISIVKPASYHDNPALLVDAPLYTQYVKKIHEYRIHVHKGNVFFVQRKARDMEVPDDKVNWQVRNHANGFIYANKDIEVDDDAKQQAILACNALGLDFGAVDIISSKGDKPWVVLEVNTAPGLTGTTLDKYVEQFKEYK